MKPYRITTEVLKIEDDHQETVRIVSWYDSDGCEIINEPRLLELESNLATSQGADYVPR
jgi:hypothetical protein